MKKMVFRVRTFLLLVVLVVLIPLALLTAYLSYTANVNTQTNLVINKHLETASALSIGFKEFLLRVVNTEEAAGLAVREAGIDSHSTAYLQEVLDQNQELDFLAFLDPEGNKLLSVPSTAPRLPKKAIEEIKKGKSTVVTDIQPKGKTGALFHVATAIKENGRTVGIMDAVINDKTVLNLARIRIGSQGNTGIIDSNGRALILTFRANIPWGQRSRTFIPSVREALKGRSSVVQRFHDPLEDIDRMGASVPISGIGWVANVFQPIDEIQEPIREDARSRALQNVLLAIILAAFIVLLVTRYITEPIAVMAANTSPLREGDFTIKIPDSFNIVEFNQLSMAFNQTTAEIQNLFKEEHTIAASLQRALAPQEIPVITDYDIGIFYASATEKAMVGGDFYDIFPVGAGKLGIVIGDIQGKGVDAAVATATAKFSLRDLANRYEDPAEVLSHLSNRTLSAQIGLDNRRFITVAYGILEAETGKLKVSVAGHPPPLICNSKECREFTEHGLILGIMEDTEYFSYETTIDRGEALVLYTDGVIEARYKGNLYGEQRLKQALLRYWQNSPNEIVSKIHDECLAFGHGKLVDDIAILMIKRKSSPNL